MITKENGWYKVDNGKDLVVSFERKKDAKEYERKEDTDYAKRGHKKIC